METGCHRPATWPAAHEMTEELRVGLRALGIDASAGRVDTLLAYRDELVRWNRVHNLSGIRDPAAMVALHLLDSVALHRWIRSGRVADVGSGAGLPGLPLAIVREDLEMVLIEPRSKRAAFLAHVIRTLGLGNVIVERCRAEELEDEAGFDTVASRAFGTLAEFIGAAAHLRGSEGILLAAKGRDPAAELANLTAGWDARVEPVRVPGIDAERHVVLLAPTNAGE